MPWCDLPLPASARGAYSRVSERRGSALACGDIGVGLQPRGIRGYGLRLVPAQPLCAHECAGADLQVCIEPFLGTAVLKAV